MPPPSLSVVVIAHRMSRQAENTLLSLSPGYQRGVSPGAYEIILVENDSDDPLGSERALRTGPNVRYLRGPSEGTSPAPAVNVGVSAARADRICLMIDGARMVTPRAILYSLWAQRIDPEALVAVPGYHIGSAEHHVPAQHDAVAEQALLEKIDWRSNGYRLFEIAVPSGANPRGVFHPLMESNFLCFSRAAFEAIGRAPEAFDLPGGGSLNLYLYRRLALRPESPLFILPGEGSFHQYHGGVTTRPDPERDAVLASHREQLARLLGHAFEAPKREPILLGAVTSWALPLLSSAVANGATRFARMRQQGGRAAWSDEPDPVE